MWYDAVSLILVYTAELFDVIASAGLTAQCYADDTQVYISAPATSASTTVQHFASCVDAWKNSNQLRMIAASGQNSVYCVSAAIEQVACERVTIMLGARVSFSGWVHMDMSTTPGILVYEFMETKNPLQSNGSCSHLYELCTTPSCLY